MNNGRPTIVFRGASASRTLNPGVERWLSESSSVRSGSNLEARQEIKRSMKRQMAPAKLDPVAGFGVFE
jgi:hypothetical protein